MAPQALFLMNGEFASLTAQRIVQSLEKAKVNDDAFRVAWLYERILSRRPTLKEVDVCLETLDASDHDRWRDLAHALFMSNEFMFID